VKATSLVTAVFSLALAAAAATAQEPPQAPPPDKPGPADKAEMRKHAREMCNDQYAHAVGTLSYLEARLALSEMQKPLFERWKSVKLASAKARLAECAGQQPPEGPPSIIDLMKFEEKSIRDRLDEIKAEMPALQFLAKTFSEDQKHVFEDEGTMIPPDPMDGRHPPGPPCGDHGPAAMRQDGPPPPDGNAAPLQ